jgi:hypothetical protein
MPSQNKVRRKPPPRPSRARKSGSSNLKAYFTTRNRDRSKRRRIYAKRYGYDGWPIGRRR